MPAKRTIWVSTYADGSGAHPVVLTRKRGKWCTPALGGARTFDGTDGWCWRGLRDALRGAMSEIPGARKGWIEPPER